MLRLCKAERNSQERSRCNSMGDETVFHKIDKDFHTEFIGYDKLEGDSEISFITPMMSLSKTQRLAMKYTSYLHRRHSMQRAADRVGDIGTIATESGKSR